MKQKKSFILSGKQWLGALIIVLLIAITIVSIYYINTYQDDMYNNSLNNSLDLNDDSAALFLKDLKEKEKEKYVKYKKDTIVINLHEFNPNTCDSIELLHLGFKKWQAHNLLQYRRSGGVIRNKEKLKDIYGMDSVLYANLEPFIVITEIKQDSLNLNKKYSEIIKKDTILELNSCDTSDLKLIRGIRSTTAKRIIKHRKELGGYVRVEQLKEFPDLSYLSDTVLLSFVVDTSLVKPINVNHASIRDLSGHPYINFTQAEELYEYRRNEVKLINIEQLRNLQSFSSEDIEKLRPYLSF